MRPIEALPDVQIAYGSGNMSLEPYDAVQRSGAKAIVHAGTGNGSLALTKASDSKELQRIFWSC